MGKDKNYKIKLVYHKSIPYGATDGIALPHFSIMAKKGDFIDEIGRMLIDDEVKEKLQAIVNDEVEYDIINFKFKL